jgi:hypothetical protein
LEHQLQLECYIICTLNDIRVYIIYYVEPIAICQENHLLLLLSDVGAQQEEESAQFAGELPTALQGARRVAGELPTALQGARRVAGEAPTAAAAAAAAAAVVVVVVVAAAQLYLQGQEKRLTHSRLTRRKYTVRLTKMLSNSMQALQRDEEVRVRAKSRLLTGSRGLL